MANTFGPLPKADPATLDDDLKHRLEVWFDKAYEDDNLFLTLARRPGVLDLFLDWVRFVYTDESSLDPGVLELCRIRSAMRNQCVHCSLVKSGSLMKRRLTEADVDACTGDLDSAALPPATIAALRLVDCLASPHPSIDGALLAELRAHYDDGQILELAAALSVAGGWQRMIEAFGIRPDIWSEAAPLPWEPSRERRLGGTEALADR